MSKYIKFYTPSCYACKQMSAYMKSKYPNLEVTELDATLPENKELVEKYGVVSVPTLVNTETEKKLVGFKSMSLEFFLQDQTGAEN